MMTEIKPRAAGLIAAAAALGIDQLAKGLMAGPLALRDRGVIELLPVFNLRWEQNYGVSMSFLTADGPLGRWLLVALTGAIALGVILGGALGNISDRLRFGYVVDFLDLHFGTWRPFLIFNTADCAISIGVAILLLRAVLIRER